MTDIEIWTRTGKAIRRTRTARAIPHDDTLRLAVVLRDWCKANHLDPDVHELRARNPSTNLWTTVTLDPR